MRTILAENVNDAYLEALFTMNKDGVIVHQQRTGPVLKLPYPLVTRYEFPQERVLFDATRDANPFFHLFESLWMLGGRDDVEFLSQFNSTIGQFSDDGISLHGAYGKRWRSHFGRDELDAVIHQLALQPETRRAVLAMWDPYTDPLVAEAGGKDVPCNTHVYFSIRPDNSLDMTVCNRSNDLIWGAYGANVVHMSILHEYVMQSLGVPMGFYYQISNDAHVYQRHWGLVQASSLSEEKLFIDFYRNGEGVGPDGQAFVPLFDRPGAQGKRDFDLDVAKFLVDPYVVGATQYRTEFFGKTVERMANAWKYHKAKYTASAIETAKQIEAPDWRKACVEWLERRAK